MARVLFLQLNDYELHGVESLAAVLSKDGHEVSLVVPELERNPLASIKRLAPQVIGIGHTTVERKEALLWARALKKHTGAFVVLGGVDPTFFPELALMPGVDAVIRGEAEAVLPELATRVEKGEDYSDLPGLAIKENGRLKVNPAAPLIPDLDTLPFPSKDLYLDTYPYFRKFPIKLFIAGRGCPHNCTYCVNKGLRAIYPNPDRYVRFKSPGYLIEELKYFLSRYPARTIGFADDLFTMKQSWLEEFLPLYRKEIGIPFFCNTRIDGMNDDKAALLAEAGCYSCWFGLETANPETRKSLLGRHMSEEAIKKGVEALHRRGIKTLTYNIMNLPGETFDDGVNTLRFNIEIKTEFAVASLFQPFPGTALMERLVAEGKLQNPEKLSSRETLSYFGFSPFTQEDSHLFHNLQKFFIIGLWFPRLLPLIKKLCRLPKNPVFDILFLGSFAIQYGRSHRLKPWEVAYYNFRHIFTTYLARTRHAPPEDEVGE